MKTGKKRGIIKGKLRMQTTQIIAVVFALIILVGTLLLMLPVASRHGKCCDFLSALFTATSAICVTGLTVGDTWSLWSGFGQAVILCLIEIGGLGFMSAASFVVFLLRRKVGLRQRMVIAQALSLNDMDGVVRMQKLVLTGSLSIQFLGALVLFFRFLPEYGPEQAVVWGVFHAVSAFCNAGFDIFGKLQPGASLLLFNGDVLVCGTLMALTVVGGLGFLVWEEVVFSHSWRKFSVYVKLVLITTLVLILAGAGAFLLLEWNNPATLGPMPVGQKILNAFVQAATLRTAGFAAVDQAALTPASKLISVVLMLIGGSSGSTAGGIKTVTVVVLLLFAVARARGRSSINVFHRSVPMEKVMDAMTITFLMLGLTVFGALVIHLTSDVGLLDAVYEAASALGTVGLSTGITPSLGVVAKWMLIVFMYFGRVGILTISLGFLMGNKAEERFQYANTNLLIG